MCERQLDLAIGGFELREMTACGSIMSDGAIDAQVILDNCLMDDLRKGKETGITRYAWTVWDVSVTIRAHVGYRRVPTVMEKHGENSCHGKSWKMGTKIKS